MNMLRKRNFKNKGQTILELSIFGGVLFMLLALILRYSISFSNAQNAQLKAMRVALIKSAEESRAYDSSNDSAKNKNASVIWIQDKPTVQGGEKYGASSRSPFMASGSGSMTSLLQLPMDYGEQNSLPIFTININGDEFKFRIGAFKKYGEGGSVPDYVSINGTTFSWNIDCVNGWNGSWFIHVPTKTYNHCNFVTSVPHPYKDKYVSGLGDSVDSRGIVFWTKIPVTDRKFCFDQNDPGPSDPGNHHCSQVSDAELNSRFNLRKKSNWTVPEADRHNMSWQWFPVLANETGFHYFGNKGYKVRLSVDVDFDGEEESILEYKTFNKWPGGLQSKEYKRYSGGDPIDEPVKGVLAGNYTMITFPDKMSRPYWFKVVDNGEGDIDNSYSSKDLSDYLFGSGKPRPGLVDSEAKIVTFLEDGSLKTSQGKSGILSNFISRQKQDSYDIIERKIQLSNDVLSSCSGGGTKYRFHANNCAGNPVDVDCIGWDCCGDPTDPNSGENRLKTCFNKGRLILFVRSIVGSKTGHKMKTQEELTSW